MNKDLNKPGIFIASSSSGLEVAKLVKDKLQTFAECELWIDVFPLATSTYDQLIRSTSFFDYGIFIATADDPMFSKGAFAMAPRDNVIFEMGLFTGALGKGRAIMILEEGAKEISDLHGITMPRIKERSSIDFNDSVVKCCDSIRKHIEDRTNTVGLTLDGSSVLAFGYFHNFVNRMMDRIREDISNGKVFELKDGSTKAFKSVEMRIYCPNDLNEDVFTRAKNMNRVNGWQKVKVDPKDQRDYDFFFSIEDTPDSSHLIIHDIPYTLNALQKSVESISKESFVGKTVTEQFLERKVLRDFKNTLDNLILNSSNTKGFVDVIPRDF